MRYLTFVAVVIACFLVAPYILNGVPDGLSWRVALAYAPMHVGSALGVLLIGSIGMLYRPDRFAGLVVGTAAAAIFYFKAVM